ncbi:MAG: YjbQ family protein, partial [Actinomycetota bacterium]|nr:YjbQ family protein [Actinomycetota bacterium]
MHTEVLTLDVARTRFLDLTDRVQRFAGSVGGDGLVNVFVPHATAGVAVIETGSGTEQDLEA